MSVVAPQQARPDDRSTLLTEWAERGAQNRPRCVELPAPWLEEPERLLEADRSGVVWQDRSGRVTVALGAAIHVRPETSGPARMHSVKQELRRAFAALGPGPRPRAYGGFSFASGAASESPWRSFGDASFLVPRWTYERGSVHGTSRWILTLAAGEDPTVGALLAELDAIEARHLRAPAGTVIDSLKPPSEERWLDYLGEIQRAIGGGEVQKVVAAQRTEVHLARPADAAGVFRTLSRRFEHTTRFIFRFGDASFVGATPELLVTKRGRTVETEALAGSIPAGDRQAAEALLASAKDQAEHAFVAEEIVERLAPLSERVDTLPIEVKELPNVLHLRTPVSAELRIAVDALDVVAALHPTSAVGGVPRELALAIIAEREEVPRGWYASPVGWVDAEGDGEFAVALRSALLFDSSAWVYAGAGIVERSVAAREYEETTVKRRAVLEALERPGDAPDELARLAPCQAERRP